jgi:disulfide bond formation protein DsbB
MKKQTIIWIIVFLIIISQALALGIRPAKTTLEFEPNTAKEFKFKIVNNDNQDLDISISIQGSLEGIIETSETKIHLNPDEEYQEISFTIHFPNTLTSDSFETNVVVQQSSLNENIGAAISLIHKLIIKVPSASVLPKPTLEEPGQELGTEKEETAEPIARRLLNLSKEIQQETAKPIFTPLTAIILIAAALTIIIVIFAMFKKRNK